MRRIAFVACFAGMLGSCSSGDRSPHEAAARQAAAAASGDGGFQTRPDPETHPAAEQSSRPDAAAMAADSSTDAEAAAAMDPAAPAQSASIASDAAPPAMPDPKDSTPIGTCGALGRLPTPAGLTGACQDHPVRWLPPALIYKGVAPMLPVQAVVRKGADGLAVSAHFDAAAVGGAPGRVRSVFAIVDEQGNCTQWIDSIEAERPYVILEARAGGGTTALLVGCSGLTPPICSERLLVPGRPALDLVATLGLSPQRRDQIARELIDSGAFAPDYPRGDMHHELAITRDGRVVVVTSAVAAFYPYAAPSGHPETLQMLLLSPTLDLLNRREVRQQIGILGDIAVTEHDELFVFTNVHNSGATHTLRRYNLAFEALEFSAGRESLVQSFPPRRGASLDSHAGRLALSGSRLEVLDSVSLASALPFAAPSGGLGASPPGAELLVTTAVGAYGALALTDRGDLIRWGGGQNRRITRSAADGGDLWDYTYQESDPPRLDPIIEAAVAEQTNGDVLASSPAEVWGLCIR